MSMYTFNDPRWYMSTSGLGLERATKNEVSALEPGMDFRLPEYRREVFMRFYQFHLVNRSHPGGVYYYLPAMAKEWRLTYEQSMWLAFLNGMCQNPITSAILLSEFTCFSMDKTLPSRMQEFVFARWPMLVWDMDRRYVKAKVAGMVESLQQKVAGAGYDSLTDFYNWQMVEPDDRHQTFRNFWEYALGLKYFGRLASFSYLEYLRILGIPMDCPELFLDDLSGSKSHRNGIAIVIGRHDLDWNSVNPTWSGYRPGTIDYLREEGEMLLEEARRRFSGKTYAYDVDYFTLESTLCCYKSWHRKNRRYPNVYNDMALERLTKAKAAGAPQDILESMQRFRANSVAPELRCELNIMDPGLAPEKQNWYAQTGQVPMMDFSDGVFKNTFPHRNQFI